MNLIEAIEARYSCRAYTGEPLEQETFDQLAAYIEQINKSLEQ